MVLVTGILGAPSILMNTEGWECICHVNMLAKQTSCNLLRLAAIGVNNRISTRAPEDLPEIYVKITSEIKEWIKQYAKKAQDSDC